jgi:hypothetical protein
MVVCLVNLDQPVEAYEDLGKALQYGVAPLGTANYEQGLTYKKLLLAQLATVEIKAGERDAVITFDGMALFTAPGDVTKLVVPGNHQIVATKPGFVPTTVPLVLLGGKTVVADVKLARLEPTRIVRRWSSWLPWLVLGAGAATAIGGGVLEAHSHDFFDRYDAEFVTECPAGCGGAAPKPTQPNLTSLLRTARWENAAAVTMFGVGGAALAAGLLGVYLNQPYAVEKQVIVTPVVTGAAAAIVVGGVF